MAFGIQQYRVERNADHREGLILILPGKGDALGVARKGFERLFNTCLAGFFGNRRHTHILFICSDSIVSGWRPGVYGPIRMRMATELNCEVGSFASCGAFG